MSDVIVAHKAREFFVPKDFKKYYIGRPSALGNPFTHTRTPSLAKFKVANVEQAISCFDTWLDEQLNDQYSETAIYFNKILKDLRSGQKIALICWCAPKPCHGDVIAKKLLQKMKEA